MRRRAATVGNLGTLLAREPRAFPGALLNELKALARTIWKARGGGYYAAGFVVTFLWLEVTTFVREVAAADSVGSFVTEQLFEFVVRFTVQSIENTVMAFLWPVSVIERWQLPGLIAVVLGYFVFRHFVKHRLERWFFADAALRADERREAADERRSADER